MAAFQFPNPAEQTTVTNPITGSTYQWKEPPGKWVVTVKMRDVGDIIWEGDNPPSPIGDYKLWYSTDTLELYFHYCDVNNVCAWVPTSAPITMLEDLDEGLFEVKQDLIATNVAVRENENRIGRTIEYSDTAPTIYPEIEVTRDVIDIDGVTVIGTETEYFFNELNYKFWYDTSRLELLVLYKDPDDGAYSYVPVSIPLESLPDPGVSTETFTYTTGRLQTAIEENYAHNLNQDLLIEDLQAQIDELKGVTTTRVMLQYDRFGSKPASFTTNSESLGSMTSIYFKGTTIQDEQLPSLKVGDTLTITGKSIGGRAILDITEAVNAPIQYKIQSRSNSNALEQDAIYLVNFTEHN